MIGLLSNQALPRGINWTLLSDSLYREMEAIAPTYRIAPPPMSIRSLPAYFHAWRHSLCAKALFSMHGSARSEWPLMLLSALRGPVHRAAFFVDPWPHILGKIVKINAAYRMDIAFIPYSEAISELRLRDPGRRYVYLPFAADTRVFDRHEPTRDIDFLWMGRRYEPLHEAILKFAEERRLKYLYRETTGFIADPLDLGRLASRARYFVVTPPDLDGAARSGGFSPLVMRYLEGLAAGCRLLGVLPRSGEFEAILPRESILEVAPHGENLAEVMEYDQRDRYGWEAAAEACELVRVHHGWDARAITIVDHLGAIGG